MPLAGTLSEAAVRARSALPDIVRGGVVSQAGGLAVLSGLLADGTMTPLPPKPDAAAASFHFSDSER